ncbi:hypothetical protein HC891_28355, partial [Candidatus Gracilibacteria bacterium]|nr:hypothetical protein [Candidatus Gracilibacteria bacterium]
MLLVLAGCSLPNPLFQVEAPSPTATVAAPTPTPIVLSETVRVQEGGFSVSLPSGWQSRALSSTLTLAPDAAALASSTPGEALVVTIDSTPRDLIASRYGNEAATDAEAFFEISSGSAQEAGYVLSATRPVTVGNQVGLGAELSAAGGTGELVVVLTDGQAIRVLGQASAEAWPTQRALFERLLAEMQFFVAAPLATPTVAGGAT